MESVLLGDPFDFLSAWPPVSFLAKIPSLALCHQVCDIYHTHDIHHVLARCILIALLQDKLVMPSQGLQAFFSFIGSEEIRIFKCVALC